MARVNETGTTGGRVRGSLLALLAGWVVFGTLAVGAATPTGVDGAILDRLEWEMVEAETAIAQGEPRIAASHFRGVTREAWYLLGLLALAENDLEGARGLLERARNAAATDLNPPRVALALVELRLGELEKPLRELRFAALEDPGDVARQRLLAEVLAAVGRRDELAAQLEIVRGLDAAVADEVAEKAGVAGASSALPSPDLGPLATLAETPRGTLRARLAATLVRTYGNLATLHRWTGFGDGAGLDGLAEEVASRFPQRAHPLGKLDLGRVGLAPRVASPRLDLVEAMGRLPTTLREALVAIDGGDSERAEHILHQASAGPERAEAMALWGRWLADRGELAEARRLLSSAVEAAPGLSVAYQDLARLAWSEGDEGEAIVHLRRAAGFGSLDRDLALALADAELAAGNPSAAEIQLRSLDRRFGSVEAITRWVRDEMENAGTAPPTLEPGVSINPSVTRLRTSREIAERKKQVFEASTRALRFAPNSEEVLLLHTRIALAIGVESSAVRTVEPLVRMRPDVAEYQLLLGKVWRHRRRMGEASEAFLKAVEIDPGYEPAFLPLALALAHESRFGEAKSYFERHLASHPDDLDALAGLAEAEERLGEVEMAERRVADVLARDPRHARAQLVLGMLRIGGGDLAAARQALERAVAADPLLAKAHYQLSLACIRLGDRECAQQHQKLYARAQEGPEAGYVQLEAAAPETMTLKSKDGSR